MWQNSDRVRNPVRVESCHIFGNLPPETNAAIKAAKIARTSQSSEVSQATEKGLAFYLNAGSGELVWQKPGRIGRKAAAGGIHALPEQSMRYRQSDKTTASIINSQ